MKQYTFILNFGYVENASLSYFPFTSTGKYKDAKTALIDLAKFLKEQYTIRFSLDKDDEFTVDDFEDWLSAMSICDVDVFHGDFIDYDTTHRWQSNGLEGTKNQRFVYQAEWVLNAALGYPHRDNRTFEDICKSRTKLKRESFSYYD